jgi:hypothetical protein
VKITEEVVEAAVSFLPLCVLLTRLVDHLAKILQVSALSFILMCKRGSILEYDGSEVFSPDF